MTAPVAEASLRRRKRVQARLTTTGAVIGLGALGARGGQSIALRRGEQGVKMARRLDSVTTNALTVGAGAGGVAGLNSAAISRAEGRQPVRKGMSAFGVEHGDISKAVDPLIRQHGLRGAPVGVDRETRQRIWEARAKHLNTRRDRWDRTSKTARAVETGTGVVAGGVGATLAAHQLRESYRAQNPAGFARAETRANSRVLMHGLKHPRTAAPVARAAQAALHGRPPYKLMALGAGSAVASAGARRGRILADKRKRTYSSASGGVASGTARRMRDYDVSKAFPLGSPEAAAAGAMRAVHDAGGHAKDYYHNCVQCRGAAGKVRAQLKQLSTPENFGKSAFGVEHELAKSDKPERTFDHRGIASAAASMEESIHGSRGSVVRPRASALARNYSPERNRGRRVDAYTAAAATGAAVSGGGAVRQRRAGRGHQRAAAAHFKDANDAFHRGNQEQVRTTQRIARHGLNAGGQFRREGLSSNRVQFGQTLKASQAAHDAFHEGFLAQGRYARSAASATRSLGRAKGLAGTSVALGATAYGLHRHQRGVGRSYGGYL